MIGTALVFVGVLLVVGATNWGSYAEHPMLAVPVAAGAMLVLIGAAMADDGTRY